MIAAIQNLKEFNKFIDEENARKYKAAVTSAKVEGFRLKKLMQDEIKQGQPGKVPFSPLTELGKRYRGKRNKPALYRLAIPVRYKASVGKHETSVEVGFIPGKVSNRWIMLARQHQEGFTRTLNEENRKSLIRLATTKKKGESSNQTAKYALLKETRTFKTPTRKIIEPFWKSHIAEANRNISNNFDKKMRGLTI